MLDAVADSRAFNAVQKTLAEHTVTYRFLWPRLRAAVRRLDGGFTAPEGEPTPPTGTTLRRQVELTRTLVEALNERTGPRTDLVVVFIPERGDVNESRPHHYLPEDGRRFWDVQREMLAATANDTPGMYFFDPTLRLRREVDTGRRLYGRVDGHLDDYGHRVLARSIHGWLTEHGYVRPNPDVDFSRRYGRKYTDCPS